MIGGGVADITTAIRSAHGGLGVVLVEKDRMGGVAGVVISLKSSRC